MEMLVKPAALQALENADNPFQSRFWAEVKKTNGWDPHAFTLSFAEAGFGRDSDSIDGSVMLVLTKSIFPGAVIAYVPFGPDLPQGGMDTSELRQLTVLLHRSINKKKLFLIRFDFPWNSVVTLKTVSRKSGSGRSARSPRLLSYAIQPEATLLLDLAPSLNTIYANFRKRAKRHIAKGLQTFITEVYPNPVPEKVFSEWYDIYRTTARRDGFNPRSADYIQKMLSTSQYGSNCSGCMLIAARQHSRMVAGSITLMSKNIAVYLFGASLRTDDQQYSPSYLVQWQAIQEARRRGCRVYDFFGISPSDASASGKPHHLQSLSQFKQSFGGLYAERPGTWDVPLRPFTYKLFSMAEKYRIRAARS
jgi:lipid II:glycine glycyltransferase (peptidoglycan interpeptide bridge formation enzyme)